MSNLIIKGARVVSPKESIDKKLNIYVKDGKIVDLTEGEIKKGTSTEVYDATGLILTPGLIDMHVHLREPGYEYKETIESGTRAAANGGVTTVACMANTEPVNDNASVTKFIMEKADKAEFANVFPIGAMTRGVKGEELCEYGDMRDAGCIALSDDGKPVMNALMMRRVMEYAKTFDLLCISHAEDSNLAKDGQMNEGLTATALGLKGIPAAAEEIMIARDITLASLTGCKLHIAHISTKGSVDIIRDAKKRGIPVTCETAPHYFTLTDTDIKDYDTNFKVNPPIRGEEDKAAIIEGLKDGTIDVIASDHAPHHKDEKKVEFMYAAFGISGIETIVPLTLKLVHDNVITVNDFVKTLSENPAKIMGLENKGVVRIGADADFTLIDMNKEFTLTEDDFLSKGKNSPFLGQKLKGCATGVVINGKRVTGR
jgi:dihydroorotase